MTKSIPTWLKLGVFFFLALVQVTRYVYVHHGEPIRDDGWRPGEAGLRRNLGLTQVYRC